MFIDIPTPILDQMRVLEEIDARDRLDGTERMQRLRQIPSVTGKFIALLAACVPEGEWIEIGTSAGYSTLWLALAARQIQRRVRTFEVLEEKATLARATFTKAGVTDVVEFVHGDAGHGGEWCRGTRPAGRERF